MLVPVGVVPRPGPGTHVGRRYEPAARRQDIVAAVAIDIAGADAVAVTVIADLVLRPLAAVEAVPVQRRRRAIELRQQLARLPVVVEIRHDRELGRKALVDFVDRPLASA